MSKSDKNHNHSHQDQSKKNIKIAFFINFIFSISEFFFGLESQRKTRHGVKRI
ncbi:hypothetical protein AB6831_00295 [Carnobacterium divergens]|uniref:hypothetical protein n=1 Tax=Carnobacterium divergens TaxID=2748 RepID=UPI001EE92CAD|nr:hypothetical protein [Carnobacterium divergens]